MTKTQKKHAGQNYEIQYKKEKWKRKTTWNIQNKKQHESKAERKKKEKASKTKKARTQNEMKKTKGNNGHIQKWKRKNKFKNET